MYRSITTVLAREKLYKKQSDLWYVSELYALYVTNFHSGFNSESIKGGFKTKERKTKFFICPRTLLAEFWIRLRFTLHVVDLLELNK